MTQRRTPACKKPLEKSNNGTRHWTVVKKRVEVAKTPDGKNAKLKRPELQQIIRPVRH